MDHADSSCLRWNEILNLIEKYHKVTSFLVGQDTLIYKNFILPKSWCYCFIRFNIHRTNASESSMMIAKDARERSGRKAQEKIIKKEGSVQTNRSPKIETDVDSSY